MIPKPLRYSQEVGSSAKVLYSDLAEAIGQDGISQVDNNALALLYNTSEQTIQSWLRELMLARFIRRLNGFPTRWFIYLVPENKELKLKLKETKPRTVKNTLTGERFEWFVNDFWEAYPKRRGMHYRKRLAIEFLKTVTVEEGGAILAGARNFAISPKARDGYAQDAIRWLRAREWKEWQEKPMLAVGNQATL